MLTGRERIRRILRHQPVDRVGLFEVFWRETAQQWSDQGHFQPPDTVGDHFHLDLLRTGGATTPATWKLLDLTANLDAGNEVVEETDVARLVRDGNGALLRWRKDRSGAPEHVDFLVKDRNCWETHIRPFLVDSHCYERRIDAQHYRATREKCAREGVFFCAGVVAVFDLMSPMCGHENLLIGMAADPDWIRDMAEVYATTTIHLLEMLFEREGLPDGLWVWDDLAFKHRPFMSPAMYRELLFRGHQRLFSFAHSRGLPVILHSDGLVESLIPQLIEAGIDCLQPLEAKAGLDVRKIKKNFGDRIALIGGMDARELISNDLDRVRKELEAKLPEAMAGGGYVLQVDHSVPDQVHYETYRYFVEQGLKMGTYR
jgi:uroporphyrinogen decarboxylase